jgi:acyl-coenzyme A synthetase/AMP-(fatty) acid ligase
MNIAQPIALHARYRASKAALIDGDRVMTYAELNEAVGRTAAHLASLGIRPGDDVAVALQDHIGTPVMWFSLAHLGARLLPMDWRWMPAEQQLFVDTFRPRLMLAEPNRKTPEGVATAVHDAGWQEAVARARPDLPMAAGGDMPATVYISSGTTGVPKAYAHSHRSFLEVLSTHWIGLGVSEVDRNLSTLPLAFTAGRSIAMSTLLCGGTFVLNPAFVEPEGVLAVIRRYGINAMTCAPGLLRGLLELVPPEGLLLPDFRRLVSVGALLFPDEIRRVRSSITPHLCNYYGSAGGGSASAISGDDLNRKPGSVGRPMYGIELEIVDDDDRVLPAGETGHLRYRGFGLSLGLLPPDPADQSIRDGWHYPGDYAFLDDEGFIFLQGRNSDMINAGGMIVFAPEVERAIIACAGVKEAAVVGILGDRSDEEIVAAVVADGGVDEAAIMSQLRRVLAAYKRPRRIRLVEALPRNSNGKLIASAIAALFAKAP